MSIVFHYNKKLIKQAAQVPFFSGKNVLKIVGGRNHRLALTEDGT